MKHICPSEKDESPLARDCMNLHSQIEWKWSFPLKCMRGFCSSCMFDTIEYKKLGYRDGCLGVGSVLMLNI